MDPFLIRLLIFMNTLNVFNTILNVIHKLQYIHGPSAHMAMAILSIIILLGYSGILNTVFLNRKFHRGRILYLFVAITCQCVVLTLSFLSYYQIITYFKAIAIIHAIFGFIVMINFTAAVLVVHQQQVQMEEQQNKKKMRKLRRQKIVFEKATKRASQWQIDNYNQIEQMLNDQIDYSAIRKPLNQKNSKSKKNKTTVNKKDQDEKNFELTTIEDSETKQQNSKNL